MNKRLEESPRFNAASLGVSRGTVIFSAGTKPSRCRKSMKCLSAAKSPRPGRRRRAQYRKYRTE
jgi:hypothetical protein